MSIDLHMHFLLPIRIEQGFEQPQWHAVGISQYWTNDRSWVMNVTTPARVPSSSNLLADGHDRAEGGPFLIIAAATHLPTDQPEQPADRVCDRVWNAEGWPTKHM